MMKQRLKSFGIALIISLGLGLWPLAVYAAGGSISLVANRATVPQGGTLIVAIYMNGGGTPIYGVESDIAFPSSKLQYVGFSANGSAFEISATNGGSDGLATVARGTVNPVSGSGLVGTVTFRALASSGSASISVAGSSSLSDGNGNAVPYGPGNTSVNFGTVAASSGSSSTPTPAPADTPKDTTPPTITSIKAKDVTPYTATITWVTNEPADSVVEYGLDANYGLSASVGTQTTTHEVLLSSSFITPKTVFHYRIKTTDGSGNVQTSPDQTVAFPGIPVTVIVRSADGKPQAGAVVTLDNDTGMTDQNGSVTLASGVGNKKVTTSFDGVTLVKPITVTKDAKKLPPVQLALNRTPVDRWMYASVMLGLVVLALLAFDSVVFGSRYFAKVFRIRVRHPLVATSAVSLPAEEEPTAPSPDVASQPSATTAPAPATAPTKPAPVAQRYTTVRPLDLQPELNLKSAANVPLSQLVNNVPRPAGNIDGVRPAPVASSPSPKPTAIQITHFADAESVPASEISEAPAETSETPAKTVTKASEKPAAPKKTRRAKKTTSKKKTKS